MPAGSALHVRRQPLARRRREHDRPARVGVVLHYAAAWVRPVENHVLAVPPDVVRTLPERLQELLGYNIYPPFIGYVDGRHPRRLLTRLEVAERAAGAQLPMPGRLSSRFGLLVGALLLQRLAGLLAVRLLG